MSEHQHEHSHQHEQGHQGHLGHDHDHKHEHSSADINTLSIDEHEGALIASGSLELTGSFGDAEQALATQLEQLARMIAKQGGVVGHIKASLFGGKTISSLSTTGEVVNISRGNDPTIRADVVAIVFAIEADQLRKILSTTLPYELNVL